jgi:hypothetical protein
MLTTCYVNGRLWLFCFAMLELIEGGYYRPSLLSGNDPPMQSLLRQKRSKMELAVYFIKSGTLLINAVRQHDAVKRRWHILYTPCDLPRDRHDSLDWQYIPAFA